MSIFHERLRTLVDAKRAHDQTSEAKIAHALEISPRRLNHYTNGNRDVPLDLVYRLCRYLGTHPNYLFGFSADPAPRDRSSTDRLRVIENEISGLRGLLREFKRNTKP